MSTGSVSVLVEQRKLGPIARVTIANDAKLNTLNSQLMLAFVGELETLSKRDDLRAVVLTGAGEKAFIGGADIVEMGALDAERAESFITLVHRTCDVLRECPCRSLRASTATRSARGLRSRPPAICASPRRMRCSACRR